MIKSDIRSTKKEKKRLLLSCSKPCLPIFNSSASPRSFPANMKLITSEFHHHCCKACGATGVKFQIQQPNLGLESGCFSLQQVSKFTILPHQTRCFKQVAIRALETICRKSGLNFLGSQNNLSPTS